MKENIKRDFFALTTDILVFSVSNGEIEDVRKLSKKHFNVLLVKRNIEPFKGMWALPGGYVKATETTLEATDRILLKETGLKKIFKEQLYTFDEVNRDPRMRTISTSYMALIDKNNIKENLNEEASWFNIELTETEKQIKIVLSNDSETIKFSVKKTLKEKTTKRNEYSIILNDKLAFDHPLIMIVGILRLREKIKDTDIIFNMLPEYFTLGELQQIYEIILNKKLLDPAFRRIIANKVEKTDKMMKTGGHRPSVLFRYSSDKQ